MFVMERELGKWIQEMKWKGNGKGSRKVRGRHKKGQGKGKGKGKGKMARQHAVRQTANLF